MKKEIKTTGTAFDVDAATVELAFAALSTLNRLDRLYASVHPAIVLYENDSVREARRISTELKTVFNNIQNMELDGGIDRLSRLYASVHPAIVLYENDSVREARRISTEIEFIRKRLIGIKELSQKIDEYYDEKEHH